MNTKTLKTLLTYTSMSLDNMKSQLQDFPVFFGLSFVLSVQKVFVDDAKQKLDIV